ncbi:LysR family transcriptional regulator [Shimia sp. MMG029]|uniref:LysR family transcriptional regulator n=1 Tax=Shimia sp. MMG029 TaxID=3021978 RepID=UPI0022FE53B8|nr:LysR family transcriptional regulator [Shimia sp. MMG029]MDA5556396.1 LysR family transcriptional regulator [Shimia sp. MMG029]
MLSHLPKTFLAIVETGSITAASEALGLAKSAVSQNLKRLEQQLDVKLAVRTTRKITLTPAGERYYHRCKEIVALSQSARTEMEAYGATPRGSFSITAPHALVAPVVAPALASLVRRFPMLEPRVIADDARLDLVAEGIDLALTVGDLPDSSFKAQRVGALQDVLCAAPSLLQSGPPQSDAVFFEWVQTLPYVAHMREPTNLHYRGHARSADAPLKLRFQSGMRANTMEAIVALAKEGLGVALLPDVAVAKDLNDGQLVRVCPSHPTEPIPIYAVHAYDAMTPLSVLEAVAALRSRMGEIALD